jgi:hypothetical protein
MQRVPSGQQCCAGDQVSLACSTEGIRNIFSPTKKKQSKKNLKRKNIRKSNPQGS